MGWVVRTPRGWWCVHAHACMHACKHACARVPTCTHQLLSEHSCTQLCSLHAPSPPACCLPPPPHAGLHACDTQLAPNNALPARPHTLQRDDPATCRMGDSKQERLQAQRRARQAEMRAKEEAYQQVRKVGLVA